MGFSLLIVRLIINILNSHAFLMLYNLCKSISLGFSILSAEPFCTVIKIVIVIGSFEFILKMLSHNSQQLCLEIFISSIGRNWQHCQTRS